MRGDTLRVMADEIRSMIDEQNEMNINDETDILPLLNRAQTKAYEKLVRVYPQPVLEPVEFTLSAGENTLELPEHLFGDRFKLIQWKDTNGRRAKEVKIVSEAQFIRYRTTANRYQPRHAIVYGRTLELSAPVAAGSGTLEIFCVNDPNPLVYPFAKILQTSGNTIFVDAESVDSDYDIDISDNSYLNIIDGGTGKIKGTVQALSFNGTDEIELKTVPDYSTVLDRTVLGSISSVSISRDDYLCNVKGSCVLQFAGVTRNFLVEWTAAKLKKNKTGAPYSTDEDEVKKFEAELRRAHMARPQKSRIRMTNRIWKQGRSIRRVRSISRQ